MGLSSDGVTFARTACDHSRTNQAFRIFSVFEGTKSNQCLTIPLTPFSGLVQAPCADTLGTGTATQVWIVD